MRAPFPVDAEMALSTRAEHDELQAAFSGPDRLSEMQSELKCTPRSRLVGPEERVLIGRQIRNHSVHHHLPVDMAESVADAVVLEDLGR